MSLKFSPSLFSHRYQVTRDDWAISVVEYRIAQKYKVLISPQIRLELVVFNEDGVIPGLYRVTELIHNPFYKDYSTREVNRSIEAVRVREVLDEVKGEVNARYALEMIDVIQGGLNEVFALEDIEALEARGPFIYPTGGCIIDAEYLRKVGINPNYGQISVKEYYIALTNTVHIGHYTPIETIVFPIHTALEDLYLVAQFNPNPTYSDYLERRTIRELGPDYLDYVERKRLAALPPVEPEIPTSYLDYWVVRFVLVYAFTLFTQRCGVLIFFQEAELILSLGSIGPFDLPWVRLDYRPV